MREGRKKEASKIKQTTWQSNTAHLHVHVIMTCDLLTIVYMYIQLLHVYVLSCMFLQCRDTYWVESFNHMLLTYIPKRIHFGTRTFEMRMYLALLDWVRVILIHIIYMYYSPLQCNRTRMLDVLLQVRDLFLTYGDLTEGHR